MEALRRSGMRKLEIASVVRAYHAHGVASFVLQYQLGARHPHDLLAIRFIHAGARIRRGGEQPVILDIDACLDNSLTAIEVNASDHGPVPAEVKRSAILLAAFDDPFADQLAGQFVPDDEFSESPGSAARQDERCRQQPDPGCGAPWGRGGGGGFTWAF
jgi:hypothetical protein